MSELIRLNQVGVQYRTRGYAATFREWIAEGFRFSQPRICVQALAGVDFALHSGERVAVLGRNGAGKSTLCRILAGSLSPTVGKISRVSRPRCVMEGSYPVDPELTGRENVLFLANLHYPREALGPLTEEILELCDLPGELDLPVKTYSRGMMARLSLAVACLRPASWLVLDEAFGGVDQSTLPRFLARFSDSVSRSGGAVVVSHNLSIIRSFCNRAVVLERGAICFEGSVEAAIDCYSHFNDVEAGK
jgi:lipopolysaccharide transport system ATP-binding protein